MHIGHTANIKFIAQFLVLFLILFGESRVFTEVTEGSITAKMPCCKESIGSHVCQEMKQRRPYEFKMRCRTDVDFAMLQCCRTCRTNVAQLGRELFSHGASSRHCFDRHNRRFCSHFVRKSGAFSLHSGCNGENAALAFRVCRRSCGFCRISLYQDDPDNDARCKTRPDTTEAPPSILVGLPDRAAHTYLERIIDEVNNDYSQYNHNQRLFNESFLAQT